MAHETPTDEHVFLSGRPPLGEYLGFLKQQAGVGQEIDIRTLSDEWRAANDHIRSLETLEAGLADNPSMAPVSPDLALLANQVLTDPMILRSFPVVPISIGVVELDHLVVYQKHVNLDHAARLQAALGQCPSEEAIFRLCMSLGLPQSAVQVAQIAANAFTFASPSTDLRFLEAVPLQGSQLVGYQPNGSVFSVIGLAVGFGANCMNAIHVEDRLVLNNGSHRAYALRDLGITHVPCIIQHVSRREELAVMGPAEVQQHPERYLTDPRPPLLKDYFAPQLRKLVAVPRTVRQVRLTFGVEQVDAPGAPGA